MAPFPSVASIELPTGIPEKSRAIGGGSVSGKRQKLLTANLLSIYFVTFFGLVKFRTGCLKHVSLFGFALAGHFFRGISISSDIFTQKPSALIVQT
jgi:hypothetical protein